MSSGLSRTVLIGGIAAIGTAVVCIAAMMVSILNPSPSNALWTPSTETTFGPVLSLTSVGTLPEPHIAGTISVPMSFVPGGESSTLHAHYWLAPPQRVPFTTKRSSVSAAPVIVWVGGSGDKGADSALYAGLTALLPYTFQVDEPSLAALREGAATLPLTANRRSWSRRSAVLLLDPIPGIGFARAEGPAAGDVRSAQAVAAAAESALVALWERHNELRGRQVFLVGDDFAGAVLPRLAKALIARAEAAHSSSKADLSPAVGGLVLMSPSLAPGDQLAAAAAGLLRAGLIDRKQRKFVRSHAEQCAAVAAVIAAAEGSGMNGTSVSAAAAKTAASASAHVCDLPALLQPLVLGSTLADARAPQTEASEVQIMSPLPLDQRAKVLRERRASAATKLVAIAASAGTSAGASEAEEWALLSAAADAGAAVEVARAGSLALPASPATALLRRAVDTLLGTHQVRRQLRAGEVEWNHGAFNAAVALRSAGAAGAEGLTPLKGNATATAELVAAAEAAAEKAVAKAAEKAAEKAEDKAQVKRGRRRGHRSTSDKSEDEDQEHDTEKEQKPVKLIKPIEASVETVGVLGKIPVLVLTGQFDLIAPASAVDAAFTETEGWPTLPYVRPAPEAVGKKGKGRRGRGRGKGKGKNGRKSDDKTDPEDDDDEKEDAAAAAAAAADTLLVETESDSARRHRGERNSKRDHDDDDGDEEEAVREDQEDLDNEAEDEDDADEGKHKPTPGVLGYGRGRLGAFYVRSNKRGQLFGGLIRKGKGAWVHARHLTHLTVAHAGHGLAIAQEQGRTVFAAVQRFVRGRRVRGSALPLPEQ